MKIKTASLQNTARETLGLLEDLRAELAPSTMGTAQWRRINQLEDKVLALLALTQAS
ncbi:hypothetical protein [Synechococcus sp. NB0720_010]|jgi:hypothetical protein|uniref:hypothetical protein n=1 Tax=Synechococcus sp. NB0720_010 TaxID=2907159 RepID=UPI001FFB3DBD|nr:hypothetical protein [Synechococcus sp. NB0720_010]UPH90077.1 hypothetical protein LY254_12610 [Synechococcus sp. NB0720_010]